jgi:hypothetical protein
LKGQGKYFLFNDEMYGFGMPYCIYNEINEIEMIAKLSRIEADFLIFRRSYHCSSINDCF